MEISVVAIEPLYQINLGYIARISKNFGIKKIVLVNPRCNHKGKEAIKYSKHARDLLTKATVTESLEDATEGTFVIGTTAIWNKTSEAFHNAYSIEKVISIMKKNGIRKISIILGRDDTGLTKEELSGCDATIHIETIGDYTALNISHALAIVLYEFAKTGKREDFLKEERAGSGEMLRMSELFGRFIAARKDIRDKRAVEMAFNHILKRASPTKKELAAVSVALSPKYTTATKRK